LELPGWYQLRLQKATEPLTFRAARSMLFNKPLLLEIAADHDAGMVFTRRSERDGLLCDIGLLEARFERPDAESERSATKREWTDVRPLFDRTLCRLRRLPGITDVGAAVGPRAMKRYLRVGMSSPASVGAGGAMLGPWEVGDGIAAGEVDAGAASAVDGVAEPERGVPAGLVEPVRGIARMRSLVDDVSLRRLVAGGLVARVDFHRGPWTSWVTPGPRFHDFTSSVLPGIPSGPTEIAPMIWSPGWSVQVTWIGRPHGSSAAMPSTAASGQGAPA
jgi:hypothetical protein